MLRIAPAEPVGSFPVFSFERSNAGVPSGTCRFETAATVKSVVGALPAGTDAAVAPRVPLREFPSAGAQRNCSPRRTFPHTETARSAVAEKRPRIGRLEKKGPSAEAQPQQKTPARRRNTNTACSSVCSPCLSLAHCLEDGRASVHHDPARLPRLFGKPRPVQRRRSFHPAGSRDANQSPQSGD